MGIIYKITNTINNKVYIGLTNQTLHNRWISHKAQASCGNEKHLYSSIRKYGVDAFTIEKIDESRDFKELGEKERYWINFYDSCNSDKGYNLTMGGESNQMDANPRAKLTVDDVKEIRKIYSECKIGAKAAWKLYKDRISYSAFEKIYEGITWREISPEVYNEENKRIHNTILKSMSGEKNGNAYLSDKQIMEIRKYYSEHTLDETYKTYGEKFKSKDSFRFTLTRGYKHLPIYNKIKKVWEKRNG